MSSIFLIIIYIKKEKLTFPFCASAQGMGVRDLEEKKNIKNFK